MEEYLSTILNDPELRRQLAEVLAALGRGKPLAEAFKAAGVKKRQGDRLLKELAETLSGRQSVRPVSRKQKAPKGLKAVVFTDGASRGNPGEAACAAIVYDRDGAELLRRTKRLGRATNNVAEYEGVLLALEICRQLGVKDLVLKLDSELVVKQIQGNYKVKNSVLKEYHASAVTLAAAFPKFTVVHVRRNDNKEADKLVNAALDGKETG